MISFRTILTTTRRNLLNDGLVTKAVNASKACLRIEHVARAHKKSEHIGNPWRFPHLVGKEHVPMWKVHWLYLMKRKAEFEGEAETGPRCNQLNWDYDAELRAFAHRLNIEVYADTIRTVFMEPLEDEPDAQNNQELYETGLRFATDFIELYVNEAFSKIGHNCAVSVKNYLTSENLISNIADNLGYRDLIQTSLATIDAHTFHRCFLASVAAILYGPGGRLEAARFLNDFVLADLLDKDIVHDIWKPKDPMKELVNEFTARGLAPPEVRLSKRAGVNSVLPVFYIALFCDKKFLVESAAESVIKAETDAAKIALKNLYHLAVGQYVPPFDLLCKPTFVQKVERISVSSHKQADSVSEDHAVAT